MGPMPMKVAAIALVMGAMVAAAPAHAADTRSPSNPTIVDTAPGKSVPAVKPYACNGTTGDFGCGPGWFWRDGWRGYACYPC